MNIVAIDGGCGYFKAIVNNKKIKFANITGNYKPAENSLIGSNDNLSIIVEGLGQWNFGNTAVLQSSGGGSRRQAGDRFFTSEFLAGLLLAISEGYSSQTREIDVDIITGLPGSEYSRYTESDKIYQKKFKNFIQGDYRIRRPGYNQQIKINSVRCTNQAWGAIYFHLLDNNGNLIKPNIQVDKLQVGSVNVGYQDIEIGTVEVSGIQNGSLTMQTASSIELSEPDGVHTLIAQMVANLTKTFNQPFRAEQAIEILENGGFIWEGKWQDYQLPDVIKNSFNERIYNHMSKVYGDGTAFLYRFINTGGGANITKNRFRHIPQLLVSDDPQNDVVSGLEKLMKAYMKKRSK